MAPRIWPDRDHRGEVVLKLIRPGTADNKAYRRRPLIAKVSRCQSSKILPGIAVHINKKQNHTRYPIQRPYTMAGPTQLRNAKRKAQAGQDMKGRPKKLKKSFKKQTDYDSGSGDDDEIPADQDFKAVNLADSEDEFDGGDKKTVTEKKKDTHIAADSDDEDEMNDEPNLEDLSGSEATNASNSDSDSDEEAEESDTPQDPNHIKIRNKRHDPEAFATSMSKILGSKLSASKRSDPVLARSIDAAQASKEITDLALEKKARQKMREDKRAAMDKGRVKDVRGASTAFDSAMESRRRRCRLLWRRRRG